MNKKLQWPDGKDFAFTIFDDTDLATLDNVNEVYSLLSDYGLITTKSAGIFELHQGEMIMDNAAVAAFRKSLDLMNLSQANALASAGGGGAPVIINNNNVDNSMRSNQSKSVSVPEATRTSESTLRALQNS